MFLLIITLAPLQEVLTATARYNMLYTDMETFLNVSSVDLLEHFYADGALGDVPDAAGLSMVVFVWHATLYCRVDLDVNRVPYLVDTEVGTEVDRTMLSKASLEAVPSAFSVPCSGWHFV